MVGHLDPDHRTPSSAMRRIPTPHPADVEAEHVRFVVALGVSAAAVGVVATVLAGGSGDDRIVLVAIASWIICALAIHELISGRLRALMVVTAAVVAVGLVMPFQNPDIVHALSAVVILLAMAGHAIRVENRGDKRFLALITGVWVSQLVWTQPPFVPFDPSHSVQSLIQTSLFFFGVRTVGMATSALSVSERRYGSLFGAAPVGLIEADFGAVGAWLAELPVDGPIGVREYLSGHPDQITEAFSRLDIREVNRTALDLLGVDSRETFLQQLVKSSNSQNTLDVLTEQLVAIWGQRAAFEMSYTAERTDGVQFNAMLGTTFPQDANGDLVLSQGIISLTDISGMVGALKMRDDLLVRVSHELRTPLTSLAGFSRELSERPDDFDDAEKAQTVDIIVREADALTYIIDNLLVAGRGDLSTLRLHMEPVEMATYLASISLNLGVIQAGKRLRFGPCEAVLYADQFRLRQILRNLVDNAVTYGGDEITIDAVTLGDTGMVTVSDNGAGLPPGKQGLVFTRYQQVAPANGQPMPLGLGLPVALTLAQAMGGDLTYSRRNGLTTFELKLHLPTTSSLSDVA